jgi:hypothetical protein
MDPTLKHVCLVHCEGQEGTIEIDYQTGQITTPTDQRPDWADGLLNAMTHERDAFYAGVGKPGDENFQPGRLGPVLYEEKHRFPEAIDSRDLKWITMDDSGTQMGEVEASHEYRMEVVQTVLQVDEEGVSQISGRVLADIEIANDQVRGKSDLELLDQASRTTFGEAIQEEQTAVEKQKASQR